MACIDQGEEARKILGLVGISLILDWWPFKDINLSFSLQSFQNSIQTVKIKISNFKIPFLVPH